MRSMRERFPPKMLITLVLLSLLPGLAFLLMGPNEPASMYVLIGAFAILVPTHFGIVRGYNIRQGHQQLDWMDELPFEFDDKTYVAHLGKKRDKATLTLRVTFSGALAEGQRESIASAVTAVHKDARLSWDQAVLVIESPPLKTKYRSGSGSSSSTTYTNREVHKWFRACVDDALVPTHSTHPIASLAATTA